MKQSKLQVGKEIEAILRDHTLSKKNKESSLYYLISSSARLPHEVMPEIVFSKVFLHLNSDSTFLDIKQKYSRVCTLYFDQLPKFNQFRVFKHLVELSGTSCQRSQLTSEEKSNLLSWYLKRI